MVGRMQKVFVVVSLLLFLIGCAGTSADMSSRSDFSDHDRQLITNYFENYAPPPTPGPGKYRTKAAQQKVVRADDGVMNKKLARGAGYPLPSTLEQQLSPLERGYGRALVGWNVVIFEMKSRKVVDRVHARGY